MKKNELKKMLKPLIKECIKECIFEDGVLSGIVTEVARGLGTQKVFTEGKTVEKKKGPSAEEIMLQQEELERQRQQRIKRLNESANLGGIDIFENTKPSLPEPTNQAAALSGVEPGDSGVDIDGIMALASGKWKHLM